MKPARLLKFRQRHPRRNLPAALARKRGESNFVSAFSNAYISSIAPDGIGGKEFALSGFGIADFVWIAWRNAINPDEGSALSIEKLKTLLNQHKLTAFEMKLSDWRKGLAQAYRYTYFADRSILVVPTAVVPLAKKEMPLFRELGVGLWSLDIKSNTITRHFTPPASVPKNERVRSRAVALLSRRIYFGERRKLCQTRV
ncbi:MAG TPA: hypothetical protein VJA21_09205 [Verrucomicrobiae bacterium]